MPLYTIENIKGKAIVKDQDGKTEGLKEHLKRVGGYKNG